MCDISPTFAEVPEGRSRTFAWSTPWRTETWVGNRAPFCLFWIKGPRLWNGVSPCQSCVICRLDLRCSVHSKYRGIIMFYHVYPCIQNLPLRVWFWLTSFFFQIRSQFKDIQLILSFISRIFAALQCAAYWHLLMFRFLSTELSDVAQGDFQLILWVGES